ncbi:aminodeoxychorismate/anthranilate synthase component II [Chitinophagales bacterium]|nr:aminodeoxychorismate/anthranilate synthase component II [Chitinophagales bacterium]
MILLIDNYDSFTYNLYDYILQLGYSCKVIRNDQYAVEEILGMDFNALVVSPGPGVPENAGICLELIERLHRDKPILGICLGYQAIGEFFGAKLDKGIKPMHGKTSEIMFLEGSILFQKMSSPISVMRYHSLVLKNICAPLNVTAKTIEGETMAFEHETLPIAGVQFHPESILTSEGFQILKNWFSNINQS